MTHLEIVYEDGVVTVYETEDNGNVKKIFQSSSKLELISWLCEEMELWK